MTSTKIELTVGPDQEDNATFGLLLRSLRDEADLSRAEAAMRIGLSAEYIRLMEKGLRVPAAGTMRLILSEYEVPCEIRSIDNQYVIMFRTYKIHFTSRIQESRRSRDSHLEKEILVNRDKMIGRIFRLMITTDDQTLEEIHELLIR